MSKNQAYVPATLTLLQQWLAKEYGMLCDVTTTGFNLGATGANQIVPFNAGRVGLVIINWGATAAFISPQTSSNFPALGGGLVLASGGGSVTMNIRDDLQLPQYQWVGNTGNLGLSGMFTIEVIAVQQLPASI